MPPPSPLVQVRSLALARGTRTLFSGLNLALQPGEVLHLRGANGAGKTSLLEAIAGLRRPAEGSIEAPPRGQVHWLAHRNAQNLALSPLENLRFWCGINDVSPGAVPASLERMGIDRQRHRPCRMLSAGQRRRCALARLLLAQRPLWLLDEPLDGLDVDGLALFAALLGEHAARGGAAIVTSHQALPDSLSGVGMLMLGGSA